MDFMDQMKSLSMKKVRMLLKLSSTTQVVVADLLLSYACCRMFTSTANWSKDQFVFARVLSGERLTIAITSIRDANSLLPVSLSVFDLDGMEGIYIPGAITRDAAKQASSQSIQDVQLYSMDNSLGVQAATAGIEAAKGLFAKKAKLIKVTVKAGYQVLLKDQNQSVL
jgi:hypothetical protein